MIQAENIAYSISGKRILQPSSFEVEKGEITVLLGPNGAGKSTLLRILAGELYPDHGSILINQVALEKLNPEVLATKRAVLTQHYAVPLPFSCEEIVMMGRYPHYKQSTEVQNKRIIDQCMEEMEVLPFARRMFNTLSGGEQQRVQMARVLAQLADANGREERILLLDEPTSSLDYLQQQLILSKIRSLAKKGYTIILVLHDLNLAAQYADKILLLKEGYMLADGSSNEVLQSSLLSMAYELDIEIISDENYSFPILIPALHNKNRISQPNKIYRNGTLENCEIIKK